MSNYIEAVLAGGNPDETLKLFYMCPVSGEELEKYNPDQLSKAAGNLFSFLLDTETDHIVQVIYQNKGMIPTLTTMDIPMFSSLVEADKIPGIAYANPGADFTTIGKILMGDNSSDSLRKWGECHYRLASIQRLVEPITHAKITFLGKEYLKYSKRSAGKEGEDIRNALRPRLCLCSPCVQFLLSEAMVGEFNAFHFYGSMLTPATAVRRRSCTKQMISCVRESLKDKGFIDNCLIWK